MKKTEEMIPNLMKYMKKNWKKLYEGLDENFKELEDRIKKLEELVKKLV